MPRGDIWISTETVAPRVAAGRFSFGWERLGTAAPEQDEFWKKTGRKRSYAKNAGGLELVVLLDPAGAPGAQLIGAAPPTFWLGIEAKDDRALQIVTANPSRVIGVGDPAEGGLAAVRFHVVADPDGRLFVRET